jgi:actin-like ATPase involved in cell morphogenesis
MVVVQRLGIDFGTSSTVAALAGPDGRVRPLLFDGSPLLPSAVFAGPGIGVLVGADAVRAAVGYPAGFEPNPKRRVDDGTVWLGEREYPVLDLVAAVLRQVAAEAARVAGATPDEVVLTHPASWGRTRLAVLTGASGRAGLTRVRLVPEPVAAAAYFTAVLRQRIPAERFIVVYDLGAGTFDVSVVRPSPGGFEVVASEGLPDVGGLDLDAAVVEHVRTLTASAAGAWQRLDWPQNPADQQARQALWHAARAVKEQLTRHTAGDLHVPLVDEQVRLTREEFEKAAHVHLDRTAALTLTVLRTAGIPREHVAGVFLVGGSSRIPLAATLLHRTLRIAPTVIDHPELVVAEGALHNGPAPVPVSAPPSPSPAPPAPPLMPVPRSTPAPPAVHTQAPVSAPPRYAPAPQPGAFRPAAHLTGQSGGHTPATHPAGPGAAPHRPGRSPRSRAGVTGLVALVAAIAALAALVTLIVVRPWSAGRDPTGNPSSPGVTTAPAATAASAFPAEFDGTWSGTYTQSDSKSTAIELAIAGGAAVAQVRYPQAECFGTLAFQSRDGRAVTARETITKGRCTPTGTMTIQRQPNGTLSLAYQPDLANYTATATLSRQ